MGDTLQIDVRNKYSPYNIDLSGIPIYVVNEDGDGNWYAMRYNSTTGVVDYAAASNNASTGTASGAFTNRATLSYASRASVVIP